jgi:hypothetical protein
VLPIPFSPDTEDTVKPLLDEEDVKHGAQNNFEPPFPPPPSKKELLIKASVVFVLVVVVVDILASFITRFDAIIVIIPRRLHILSYVLFVSLRSSLFYDEREKRKKEKILLETWRIFCLGCTTLTRTQNLFFPFFSSLVFRVLDKFLTEIGANISNDSCKHHHDER